jgi:hypothetical protein
MGNSKKGTAVEETLVFTGDQQDFEQIRTVTHNNLEEKDNPHSNRPQYVFGKEDYKCVGVHKAGWSPSHTRSGLGQEQKRRDLLCLG